MNTADQIKERLYKRLHWWSSGGAILLAERKHICSYDKSLCPFVEYTSPIFHYPATTGNFQITGVLRCIKHELRM